MSEVAIRAEGLGKCYRITTQREPYHTLRAALVNAAKAPFRLIRLMSRPTEGKDTIWALKNVSFEVKNGEAVGIIGRNGAGKTTLLRLLSRITKPTAGRAEICGRVGSLLEVGTGFHPELSGRENVYLNGSILGMTRKEIRAKFDEIVSFAEIERFIDTPMKRYSSGMQVRLAFSVAAHLEPEILLVDEVLAVGDAAFQKKCLGRMSDVARGGRTILFVSHNMMAVQTLCGRAIWLEEGEITKSGPSDVVVSEYLQSSFSSTTAQVWEDAATAPGNEKVRLHAVRVRPESGVPTDPITVETPFVVEVEYWNMVPESCLDVTLQFFTEHGVIAFGSGTAQETEWHGRPLPRGLFRSICHVPGNLLNDGTHRLRLLVVKDQGNVIFRHDDILSFEVLESGERRNGWYGRRLGAVRPTLTWETRHIDELL